MTARASSGVMEASRASVTIPDVLIREAVTKKPSTRPMFGTASQAKLIPPATNAANSNVSRFRAIAAMNTRG